MLTTCGLFGNEWAERIAEHGALENTPSHIDIPLSTREMCKILENRVKTDRNVTNSSILKAPDTLSALIFSLIVNS